MPKNISLEGFRMPGEWEVQKSVWIVWPYNKKDWPGLFDKIPEVVQEKLPPVTEADVGKVFIVEKEDPKTKVKTRIAVEIILDENKNVGLKTLMKV